MRWESTIEGAIRCVDEHYGPNAQYLTEMQHANFLLSVVKCLQQEHKKGFQNAVEEGLRKWQELNSKQSSSELRAKEQQNEETVDELLQDVSRPTATHYQLATPRASESEYEVAGAAAGRLDE